MDREHTLDDLNLLTLLRYCCCWTKCPIMLVVDSVVYVIYILTNTLFVLLVTERKMLKTLTVIVDLPFCPFSSVNFCFMYVEAVLLIAYISRIVMSFL